MNEGRIVWGKSDLVNINLHVNQLLESYQFTLESDELTNVDRSTGVSDGCEKIVQSTLFELVDEMSEQNAYAVLQDFYVRNQKLYLRSATKSLFVEWITSLRLLCTSFFKILSNEIYYKVSVKLRLRAIVCTVAVPTVALMGLLMPFASCYFNRIVGDLDCWMNGFDNEDMALSSSERQTRSDRCFAVDLHPYGVIGQNPDSSGDINICKFDLDSCVPILVDDLCRKYINGGEITMHVDDNGTLLEHRLVRDPNRLVKIDFI